MSADAENRFDVEWEKASPDVLRDACCLSQQILRRRLEELAWMHAEVQRMHAEAARRGVAFPNLITAAEKAALEFVSQNPLQN